MQNRHLSVCFGCVFSTLIFSMTGCGGSGEAKYVPSEGSANEALNVALQAWRDGQPYGTITSYKVPIDTYDARWQAGEKLEKFEVIRSEQLDQHKAFVVKIKLASDQEEQEDTYLVIGNNPLMVFRKQDYDKASGVGGG